MWKFLLCGLLLCSLSSLFGTNTITGSEENLLPPEPKVKFTSFSRVFYDDNIFTAASGAAKDDSLFYSQTLKIAYKDELIQAAATPELRYRQADGRRFIFGNAMFKKQANFTPKLQFELGGFLSHAEKEPTGFDDVADITFLMGKWHYQVTWHYKYLDKIKVKHETYAKAWSENAELSPNVLTNGDFWKDTYTFTYERIMNRRFIGELIYTYADLEYNGDRGGFEQSMVQAQLSYVPNSFMIIKGNLGYIKGESFSEEGISGIIDTPTYGANVTFFTPRGTLLGFNAIYEVVDSSIAYWNTKETFKTQIMAKYPITPKLEISAMLMTMHNKYEQGYNRYDAYDLYRDEKVVVESITLSWKRNHSHYYELGYQGLHLFNDDANVFRNKIFLGYRIDF